MGWGSKGDSKYLRTSDLLGNFFFSSAHLWVSVLLIFQFQFCSSIPESEVRILKEKWLKLNQTSKYNGFSYIRKDMENSVNYFGDNLSE